MSTGIEWTDETWNPILGCSRVSPGCDHCYAERDAGTRLRNVPAYSGLTDPETGKWTGRVNVIDDRFEQPLRWARPRRVFVNSMSDLFHPDVDDLTIARVFAVMSLSPRHIFQVLTKRPKAMAGVLSDPDGELRYKINLERRRLMFAHPTRMPDPAGPDLALRWPLPNVWLGTSIERQEYAFRATHLLHTPAAVRFVSAEPLLGPVDLTEHLHDSNCAIRTEDVCTCSEPREDRLDWVIVGGESGREARPMHPAWARSLRDQCQRAGVAFLFKQWGEYGPAATWPGPDYHVTIDGHLFLPGERLGMNHLAQPAAIHRWGKHAAGRKLDGRTWDEYPPDPRQLLINIL